MYDDGQDSSCSTAGGHMLCNQGVLGLNSAGCLSLFLFLSISHFWSLFSFYSFPTISVSKSNIFLIPSLPLSFSLSLIFSFYSFVLALSFLSTNSFLHNISFSTFIHSKSLLLPPFYFRPFEIRD